MEDFKHFVGLYNYNTITRISLPHLIASKINEIVFSLACGLVEICTRLGLLNNNTIEVFEAITRMYEDCEKVDKTATPYKIDKILRIISSGDFDLDKENVGRHREEFLIHKVKLYLITIVIASNMLKEVFKIDMKET